MVTMARALKDVQNDYAHARWHVPDYSETDDPEVVMLPLNWEWNPDRRPEEARMRLTELAEQARAVSECIRQLNALMEKHLRFAAAEPESHAGLSVGAGVE